MKQSSLTKVPPHLDPWAKVRNKYHVAPNNWHAWSTVARRVFNETYSRVKDNQSMYNAHPLADWVEDMHWRTIAWNIAWEAADAASGR